MEGNKNCNRKGESVPLHGWWRAAAPSKMRAWFRDGFLGIFREFRWSCLPPHRVYFAAGISGFTGTVESFARKGESSSC